MSASPHHAAPGGFAQTRWSMVIAAGGPSGTTATVKLAELCAIYWYPLYVFVTASGSPEP